MNSERGRQTGLLLKIILPLFLLALTGCRVTDSFISVDTVSGEVEKRTGHPIGQTTPTNQQALPPGVTIEDGLTEDEVIAIALWRNTAYRALLSELGISRAQLYDAGLLTDPQFIAFFPIGPKQLEFAFFFALDAVWLRPIREQVAALDVVRVAEQMVQNGLNTIRDARLAHADLLFTQDRAKLAVEAQKLRDEITELAKKRLKAGDISELEAITFEVEAQTARADAQRFAQDVILAQNRLRAFLGLSFENRPLVAKSSLIPAVEMEREKLVQEALALRPDLRAAEINADLAEQRIFLEKKRFMLFDAVLDANSRGTKGFEAGPGVRMTIPLFNRNRGQVAIADALWQQAEKQTLALRDQIVLEVRTAHNQLEQANENLATVQKKILPTLRSAIELARKNYLQGGSAYVLVLQTTAQYLNARASELDLSAARRRARAELERSVGHRLTIPWPEVGICLGQPQATATGDQITLFTEVSKVKTNQESTDHATIRIDPPSDPHPITDRMR